MKIKFHWTCKPKSKRANYDAEDIHLIVDDFPFMPVVGMQLKLTPRGAFGQVDEVFWDCDEPDLFGVYLKDPELELDLYPWADMKAEGWKLSA